MYSGCKTHRVDGEGTAALNIERDRQGNEMRVSLRTFFTCSILLGMVTLAQTTISPINSQGSMGFQAFASPSPSYSNHIVFIILENHPLSSVTCSGCAPYMMSLGNLYANSTNYVGPVSSTWNPSLPNYLGLVSGQTWGCASDPPPNSGGCATAPWTCSSPRNVIDRFSKAGVSWKGYMEGMPAADICNGNGGAARRTHHGRPHKPIALFGDTRENSTTLSLVSPSPPSGAATTPRTTCTRPFISR